MPANEQTWYDQPKMHLIFGISSLAMLVASLWMFAKDHNREWKKWQLADRGKERWAIEARLVEEALLSEAQLGQFHNELQAAQTSKIDLTLVERFKQAVTNEEERLAQVEEAATTVKLGRADFTKLDKAVAAMTEADEGSSAVQATRQNLLAAMDQITRDARHREDTLAVRKKFVAADQTAAVSERGIAVGEGKPQEAIDPIEERLHAHAAQIAVLDNALAGANDYRVALETVRKEMLAPVLSHEKKIAAIEADLDRLRGNLDKNTSNVGEWFIRQPVLDALYDGNIRLDQIWLPDMTINYNFNHVARFDRCTNCHRAIDQTQPGSAVDPAYPALAKSERQRTVWLETPDAKPAAESSEGAGSEEGSEKESPALSLADVYGLILAPRGQVEKEDVTIQVVLPGSLAAKAGLEMGDVLEAINQGHIHTKADVEGYLLYNTPWGEPQELSIRRGLAQPYTSHPRLDLFVGSLSPHKKGEVGCTICHDGQGSATEFKWASHTPNDPNTALDWDREHGWFDNHHWIFPMTPHRFVESNCLKCHHEVVELEPSERFPEPPAPKLVEGYHLVRKYGCFGCHEINGYDGPEKRIGPDLRREPNYFEVATQVLQDEGLDEEEQAWATTLVNAPDADEIRNRLYQAIKNDNGSEESRLSKTTHALANLLKDIEAPGKLRKAGPSLRYLDAKVDYTWLYHWIRKPANFRPSTRMPQFFELHGHLEGMRKEFKFTDASGEEQTITDKEQTERFEEIEIRALTDFLLANSQSFAYLDPPSEVTESPSAERGRWLFESRGCLACHSHQSFPGIASDQGPDLSRVSTKFGSGKGQRWLYSWVKSPHRYHTRTVMPDLYLDPITETDAAGEPTGEITDPAADVTAFLLGETTDWQPPEVINRALSADQEKALEDLTTVWLSASFPKRRAERYAREGIPERLAATVKVDEQSLLDMTPGNRTQKQLEYVARRSLGRYGCFGCHDIAGYEGAKPIGTPLAEWGRKEPTKLAFENIGHFLATHGLEDNHDDHGHDQDEAHGGGHGLDPRDFDDDTGYYLQSLNSHQRQGFLWQKLRQPRSFDYETTISKRYDERLRMPKFPFNKEQREAVITFVLGLVNEAPAEKYIYKPDPRQEAIVQGRHVLEKYNCAGCHTLDMERWKVAFDPDWFEEPPETNDFPFLAPDIRATEVAASLRLDRRGRLHAELVGRTTLDEETGKPKLVDEDGVPIDSDDDESDPFYEFSLWKTAIVSGEPRQVGVQKLLIPAKREGYGPAEGHAFPAHGGDLANYLFPRVIAEEKKINPQVKGSEAWSWLPPPLMDEGEKVQTGWLHDFLMDPHAIRPGVVMRMPNFRMSSDDASKLVNYFAAMSNSEFPYEYNVRRRGGYLAAYEQAHPERLEDAMKVVTDGNYCVKCHAVGDFEPKGSTKALGPNLADVYQRLRPSFVRRWLANPQRILPYTGMPVNIAYANTPPHFGGVKQDLFPGTSTEQLDGLVDLLMNYDEYAKRQTSIRPLIKEAPVEVASGGR